MYGLVELDRYVDQRTSWVGKDRKTPDRDEGGDGQLARGIGSLVIINSAALPPPAPRGQPHYLNYIVPTLAAVKYVHIKYLTSQILVLVLIVGQHDID